MVAWLAVRLGLRGSVYQGTRVSYGGEYFLSRSPGWSSPSCTGVVDTYFAHIVFSNRGAGDSRRAHICRAGVVQSIWRAIIMNGGNDFDGNRSRSGADGTTNSGAFQQGRYYSGGYALPGVFGDAGQTQGGGFTSIARALAVGGPSSSGVETSTPMVLGDTPPRHLANSLGTWGGAAPPGAPRVLFAPVFGQQQLHSEVRDPGEQQ